MEIIGVISLLAGIIQLVNIDYNYCQVFAFFMFKDVNEIKEKMTIPSRDFKTEFYKWYSCGNVERAKEVLVNEIGKSYEFEQLVAGGNPKYMDDMKEQLKKKYQTEIALSGIELNLNCLTK